MLAHGNWNNRIIQDNDAIDVYAQIKYDKISFEPLSGNLENFIETVNQSQTYIVSIKATEILLDLYPDKKFILNWGNVSGHDIESIDGTVIAECFAATSYRSNGKLREDLKRLEGNKTAQYKYEIFYDRVFDERHKVDYSRRYPSVTIIKLNDLTI